MNWLKGQFVAKRRRQHDRVWVGIVGSNIHSQRSWRRRNEVAAIVGGIIELTFRDSGDGQ